MLIGWTASVIIPGDLWDLKPAKKRKIYIVRAKQALAVCPRQRNSPEYVKSAPREIKINVRLIPITLGSLNS